jgi:hypothetical protein
MQQVRLRLALLALVTAALFAWSAWRDIEQGIPLGVGNILTALALLLVVVIIDYLAIALPIWTSVLTFAVSGPIMVSAVMHFGPFIGSIIVAVALIVDEVVHQRPFVKSATNVVSFLATIVCTGLVYRLLYDGTDSPLSSLQNFGASIVASLVFAVFGQVLFALVVAPALGTTPFGIVKHARTTMLIDFISVPTIGGLVVILANENALAVLLLLLPMLAPQLAYRTLQRAQRDIRDTIESLADAIERRDRYTSNHSTRVAGYVKAMLNELSDIPDGLAETIVAAARVHDVGKVGIKDSTLLKPGPLTTEERLELQQHTIVGAEIVSRIAEYRLCAAIIRHHHERWDGGGYPDGISGEDIPIGSRIICVADAFDAMTSDRPYRRAMSAEAAIEEVRRSSGTQFDPRVVQAFERIMSVPAPVAEPATQPGLAVVNPVLSN